MALTQSPFGTFVDVTGVVNATAAAEIVTLGANLKALLPLSFSEYSAGQGTPVGAASEQPELPPGFDKVNAEYAELIGAEIDALLAAIAAAPTA